MWTVTFAKTDDPRDAVRIARTTRPGHIVVGEHRDGGYFAFVLDLEPAGLELTHGVVVDILRGWRSLTHEKFAAGTGDPAARRDCLLLVVPLRKAKYMRRIFRFLLEQEGSYELSAELAAKAESKPVA